MINLKKVGLTALAGSLVAFSANAVEFAVSGGVELTYVDTGGTHGNQITGNSFGANSGITFNAVGDVGFGTLTVNRALSDTAGMTTDYQSLDMGDLGTLSFDTTGGALVGLTAKDDLLPTAYEEAWTGVGNNSSGITGVGSTNVIGYQNTMGGISISAGYTNAEGSGTQAESGSSGDKGVTAVHGSTTDVYLSAALIDGLTLGAGISTNTAPNTSSAVNEDTTRVVGHIVYSSGPLSVGYRMGETNLGTISTASTEVEGYSIAFNVNDNFAISYGSQELARHAIGATAGVTEESDGFSAAYTVGAASIRMNHSKASNAGYESGVKDETTEIGVVLSF